MCWALKILNIEKETSRKKNPLTFQTFEGESLSVARIPWPRKGLAF